jgi:hypothetical protein
MITLGLEPTIRLTMRVSGHSGDGSGLTQSRPPYQYEVEGLWAGVGSMIVFVGHSWRVLQTGLRAHSPYQGDYQTAEDALLALNRARLMDTKCLRCGGEVPVGDHYRLLQSISDGNAVKLGWALVCVACRANDVGSAIG